MFAEVSEKSIFGHLQRKAHAHNRLVTLAALPFQDKAEWTGPPRSFHAQHVRGSGLYDAPHAAVQAVQVGSRCLLVGWNCE